MRKQDIIKSFETNINYYKNVHSPKVINDTDIFKVLYSIKNPRPPVKAIIDEAREYKKEGRSNKYKEIKTILPCVTFNFRFNDWKKDSNIISPTGLIYLDVDNTDYIDTSNPLIFAKWRSLSNEGFGILIKVNNLSKNNFKQTYIDITKELNTSCDLNAAKPSQFNILSYDSNLYLNNDSITWVAKEEIKNNPSSVTYKKRKRKDATELGSKSIINYNNISLIDFGGNDYIFFPNEKKMIAKAWIPEKIKTGSRNETLSILAYQLRALNPTQEFEKFSEFILAINSSRCIDPLPIEEVKSIVYKINKTEILEPILNCPRRIIFNPECSLSPLQKRVITNKLNGRLRSEKTRKEIKSLIEKWEINLEGKITQKKLADKASRNIKTINKYYKEFKEQVHSINSIYYLKASREEMK